MEIAYEVRLAQHCYSRLLFANAGDVTSAFENFSEGLGIAATFAGMPAKGLVVFTTRRKHSPFFDGECLSLKRQARQCHHQSEKPWRHNIMRLSEFKSAQISWHALKLSRQTVH